jgi:hypothetical protein
MSNDRGPSGEPDIQREQPLPEIPALPQPALRTGTEALTA